MMIKMYKLKSVKKVNKLMEQLRLSGDKFEVLQVQSVRNTEYEYVEHFITIKFKEIRQ